MLSTPTAAALDCRWWPGAGGPSGRPRPTRPGAPSVGWRRAGSPGEVRNTLTSTSPLATESMGPRAGEVDAVLLVGLGGVIGQGRWAAEGLGTGVEDGQLQGEATLQPQVPVQDGFRGRSCRSPPRTCLGWVGTSKGTLGSRCGIGRLVAVGVHEPAPRAAADGLPPRDRAGLKVLHHDRARSSLAPDQNRAQREQPHQRCRDRAPATPDPTGRRDGGSIHGHRAHPASPATTSRPPPGRHVLRDQSRLCLTAPEGPRRDGRTGIRHGTYLVALVAVVGFSCGGTDRRVPIPRIRTLSIMLGWKT